MLQQAIVILIVAGATAYAAWALMPAAWRRWLARRLGRPEPAGGCGGCADCGAAALPDQAAHESVVRLLRPRR
jgi:hypothetical protein